MAVTDRKTFQIDITPEIMSENDAITAFIDGLMILTNGKTF